MATSILRRRRGLGAVTVRDFASASGSTTHDLTTASDLSILTPKYSGSHSLVRSGYDESSKLCPVLGKTDGYCITHDV